MIHDNVCEDPFQSVIGVSIDDLHYWKFYVHKILAESVLYFSFFPWVVVFLFFQICDVAEVAIIDKSI